MKTKLIECGLLVQGESGDPIIGISSAWSVLARLGYPGRYAGKTLDGLYEYVIVDSRTGTLLTSGKGSTLPMAMCEAALAVRTSE